MHKIISKIMTGLVIAIPLTASYADRGDIQQLYQGQSVDDMVIQFMLDNHIPGMSVSVIQTPYVTRNVGYGLADTDTKRLVSTNTVFNIGQITTAYTAVAIMQLVESGKLKLSDPVSNYVSGLPETWSNITLNHLMTHSSGIPSYTRAKNFNYGQMYTSAQIIDLIKNQSLLFKPGTQIANSATDFYLLGLVIEKVSGLTYEDFIKKNQIERLGLKHSYFISTINTAKNEIYNQSQPFKHNQFKHEGAYINAIEPAFGFTEKNNQLVAAQSMNETAAYANAGMITSAQDIGLWEIGLEGDMLLKEQKSKDFLFNSITLDNGHKVPANAGWQFPGRAGFMYIEGNVPGFTAFFNRFSATNELLCVSLLTNKDNVPNLEILARNIAGAYDAHLATPTTAIWMVTRQSPYTVSGTLDRLALFIKQQGGSVLARIDRSADAGQSIPMQILIINRPDKMSSMPNNNSLLHAITWRDQSGQVWLSFTNPIELGKAYHLQGQEKALEDVFQALSQAAKYATSAY